MCGLPSHRGTNMYISAALIPLLLVGALSAASHDGSYVPPQPSKPSKIEDFSSIVSLHSSSKPVCAGSILDDQHVLTTARCANLIGTKNSRVRSESSLVSSGGKTHEIANVSAHPSYNPRTNDYDVAILTVKPDTPLNKTASIQIAKSSGGLRMYQAMSVYGWGSLEQSGAFSVEVLPFMDRHECNRFFSGSFSSVKLVTERMLCSLVEPRYARTANFGSPAILDAERRQVAISSWNRGRPDDIYTVYTDLTNKEIQDFISAATGISF